MGSDSIEPPDGRYLLLRRESIESLTHFSTYFPASILLIWRVAY